MYKCASCNNGTSCLTCADPTRLLTNPIYPGMDPPTCGCPTNGYYDDGVSPDC